MGFLKPEISTLDVMEGVLPWAAPTPEEVHHSDQASQAAGGLDASLVLHEFFLLKAAVTGQYAMGLLETLGMKREGIEQFHHLYASRLAEGLQTAFKGSGKEAVVHLASRLKGYDEALHRGHPEDPHLGLADAFTRACGRADDPALVSLCLDACRALNQKFMAEIKAFGLKTS